MEKGDVNGKDAHPLWKWMQNILTGFLVNSIKWNFSKFVFARDGRPVERFGPKDSPNKMIPVIEKLLAENAPSAAAAAESTTSA
ncbi:thioredoxin-like protein [Ramicandelaber brevisporus]|nr:thioredoxin-like protein [Ramicandelaber brevisporus]